MTTDTRRGLHYTCDENFVPIPCADMEAWAAWMESADRCLARTVLESGRLVSTVFLGIDHAYMADQEPLLFETMVFPPPKGEKRTTEECSEELLRRYTSAEEAVQGHNRILAMLVKEEAVGSDQP